MGKKTDCTCGPDSDAVENIHCPTHGIAKLGTPTPKDEEDLNLKYGYPVDAGFVVDREWWLHLVEEFIGRPLTEEELKIKLPSVELDREEVVGFVTHDLAADMKYTVGLYLITLILKNVTDKGFHTITVPVYSKIMEAAEHLIDLFWIFIRMRYPERGRLGFRELKGKIVLVELKPRDKEESSIQLLRLREFPGMAVIKVDLEQHAEKAAEEAGKYLSEMLKKIMGGAK